MKKLYVLAALLMASTSAHAGGYSFHINGHSIRIDVPRHCGALSCISISAPGLKFSDIPGLKSSEPEAEPATPQTSAEASDASVPAPTWNARPANLVPTPAAPASAERVSALSSATPQQPQPAQASPAPTAVATAAPAQEQVKQDPPKPEPVKEAAVQPAPKEKSALGTWMTEKKEGLVRIEPCGTNICGYSVNQKTNANGEKVLIDMKPAGTDKWRGRIKDTRNGGGGIYDSTVALHGDKLRVTGCAFGGLFCGGQTWTRVN
jgi:hypothetical protein